MTAARGVVLLVKHVADSDFEFLDPVIGVSFSPLFPPHLLFSFQALKYSCVCVFLDVLVTRGVRLCA